MEGYGGAQGSKEIVEVDPTEVCYPVTKDRRMKLIL